MNTRFNTLLFYLLMCCVALQQVIPFSVRGEQIEFCEGNAESEGSDSTNKKESFNEWKSFRDGTFSELAGNLRLIGSCNSPLADSEKIPDSAFQAIFSPPPNMG